MKADLDENGVLHLRPEIPVEGYALYHWLREQTDGRMEGEITTDNIIFHLSTEPEEGA